MHRKLKGRNTRAFDMDAVLSSLQISMVINTYRCRLRNRKDDVLATQATLNHKDAKECSSRIIRNIEFRLSALEASTKE